MRRSAPSARQTAYAVTRLAARTASARKRMRAAPTSVHVPRAAPNACASVLQRAAAKEEHAAPEMYAVDRPAAALKSAANARPTAPAPPMTAARTEPAPPETNAANQRALVLQAAESARKGAPVRTATAAQKESVISEMLAAPPTANA